MIWKLNNSIEAITDSTTMNNTRPKPKFAEDLFQLTIAERSRLDSGFQPKD
jgi:hypothetical protein